MSLASKMRVDQMLEQIHIDAKFDFDYVAFLCAPSPPPGQRQCHFIVFMYLVLPACQHSVCVSSLANCR